MDSLSLAYVREDQLNLASAAKIVRIEEYIEAVLWLKLTLFYEKLTGWINKNIVDVSINCIGELSK